MDNLAHTLVGAALGRAIAGHRIRDAGLVGAVAGNAPDWTELLAAPGVGPPRSGLTYLEWHRGITHSLLGAAIEIAALTLLVGLGELWWSRRRGPVCDPGGVRGRRGGVGAPLVRRGGTAPGGGIWTADARPLRRRQRRRQPPEEGARARGRAASLRAGGGVGRSDGVRSAVPL